MKHEDYTEEIERLIRRAERDPRTHTFARLADLYRKSGDLDRALEVIRGGLKYHPHYLNARLVHAKVLREMGRPDAARQAFEKVLDIDSENLVARGALDELGSEAVAPARGAAEVRHAAAGPAAARWLARLDADWREVRGNNGSSTRVILEDAGIVAEQAPDESVVSAETPGTGPGGHPEVVEPAPPAEGPLSKPIEASGPAETVTEAMGLTRTDREAAGSTETEARADDRRPEAGRDELETATLAALYVRQGLFDRAIGIYERLLARDPYNARLAGALEDARLGARQTDGPRPAAKRPQPTLTEISAEPGRAPDLAHAERPASPDPAFDPAAAVPGSPDPSAEPASGSIRSQLGLILDGVGDGSTSAGGWADWLERLERDRD